MKIRPLLLPTLFCLICLSIISCRKYSGFKHDTSGYYYHYFNCNENNEQPQTGDFVVVNMGLRTKDSVISPMTQNNMLVDELYKGDLNCALRDMHLGDSATFIFDGPQFYEEFLGMGNYPFGKKPIYVDIKLLKIMSKQNMEKAEERYQEHKKLLRHIEDSLITDYAAEYRINDRYHGLRYSLNKRGSGPCRFCIADANWTTPCLTPEWTPIILSHLKWEKTSWREVWTLSYRTCAWATS